VASPVLPNTSMDEQDPLTGRIIGCAIEVHRALGAGLLESAYHTALCVELAHQKLRFDKNRQVPLEYRGVLVGEYNADLIVEDQVIVEVKSVLHFEPVFVAQVLTYLRITGLKRGLLLNFNKSVLKNGIQRISL
jgi:GxxExxY protein